MNENSGNLIIVTLSLTNFNPNVILYSHGLFYHIDGVKINLDDIHQGKCNEASLKLSSIFLMDISLNHHTEVSCIHLF